MIDDKPRPADRVFDDLHHHVHELHLALSKHDALSDAHPFDLRPVSAAPSPDSLSPPPDIDDALVYRRMSSSTHSLADTDVSSRGEKRPLTPDDSPQPKRARPTLNLSNDVSFSHEDAYDAAKGPSAVQLPSIYATFDEPFRQDLRRMSVPVDAAARKHIYAAPAPPRATLPPSTLSSYQFPPPQDPNDPSARQYGDHPAYHNGVSPIASYSNTPASAYGSPLTPEPSSTPGLMSAAQQQLFGGPTRIVSHNDRRASTIGVPAADAQVKTEQWTFPATDFGVAVSADGHQHPNSYPNTPATAAAPLLSASGSPTQSSTRSPASALGALPPNDPPNLIERPARKRGKLPKHVTDYLKDWLHRHSDHPYPSEEEKKHLCVATGLSMSQVSNWMINARRRILAPAQRAAAANAAASPYAAGRAASQTSAMIEASRRASLPTHALSADVYHANHLGMSSYPHPGADYALQHHRPMMGMASRQYGSLDGTYATQRLAYTSAGHHHPHPHSHSHSAGGHAYLASGVPMSAPPTMGANPFSQPAYQSSVYGGQRAYYPATNGGSSQGSSYGTPQ